MADKLSQRGLVRVEGKTVLALSQIGMVVRAGAAKPDISNVDAFRKTLLVAKSIAYSDSGSGTYIGNKMYTKLGIADQVAGKAASARSALGRTRGRRRGARRSRNRLSAGQRTHSYAGRELRRRDSG